MPPIATTYNNEALANHGSTNITPAIQRDFTSALPYDIVGTIFSHVTKSDCLKCMSVSRKWLDHVPQYTNNLWHEMTISSLETLNNALLMRCLGPHLKKLRLRGLNECEIGMVIHGLVQKSRCTSIRSVELFHCRTTDRRVLSEAFRPIVDSLVDLSFRRHTHAMDLHAFLRMCPKNITLFTFDTSGSPCQAMIMDRDYSVAPPPPNEPPLPQLQFTYLNLHATLYRYEIDYVLQQCSQLKCLLFDSIKPYGHTMMHVIEACVQLCPSLVCLAWGRIRPDFVSHWKSKASLPTRKATERRYEDDDLQGLQEIVCGSFYHGGHSFTQMLLAHHRTLRIVRLERLQNQPLDPWYPTAPQQNVTFNQLQVIYIDNIHVNAESLARWIYCCRQLEELSLHAVTVDDPPYWLDRVFQALGSSGARLKRLHITHDRSADRNDTAAEEGNGNDDSNNDVISHDEEPIYTYLIQARHQLESIRLSGKGLVTNAILEALTEKTNASTLRHVALDYSATENNRYNLLTTDGLHAFAHNLHWKLDELEITEHQEDALLTDELLMHLSTKVKRLSLKGCTKLTGCGLKALVDNGHRNGLLVSLQLVECTSIDDSTDSIEYARTVLGHNNVHHVSSQHNADNDTVYFVYM